MKGLSKPLERIDVVDYLQDLPLEELFSIISDACDFIEQAAVAVMLLQECKGAGYKIGKGMTNSVPSQNGAK